MTRAEKKAAERKAIDRSCSRWLSHDTVFDPAGALTTRPVDSNIESIRGDDAAGVEPQNHPAWDRAGRGLLCRQPEGDGLACPAWQRPRAGAYRAAAAAA